MRPELPFLLLGILLILPLVSGMDIIRPEPDLTYRDSIIDVNYTDNLTGAKTCYYSFGMAANHVIQGCKNISLEVPINTGHINLTLTEVNDTHAETDKIEVWIDNDLTTGKALLLLGFVVLFLILPFIFWYPCFKMDYLHTPIKLFLALLGFFSGYMSLTFGQVVTENYVHNSAILGVFSSFIVGYRWILYSIMAYFLISFLFNVFEMVVRKKGGVGSL